MAQTTDYLLRLWFNTNGKQFYLPCELAEQELMRRDISIIDGWVCKGSIQVKERGQHGPTIN